MLRGVLLFILLPLLVTPLLILVGFSLFQEKLLFHAEALPRDYKFNFAPSFEQIRLPVQGKQIHSLFFPVPTSKNLILYFHGNAGNLADWGTVAGNIASRLQSNVWIMDYPGFGLSEGRVSAEAQFEALADTFANAVSERGRFERVIIYGRSIGSGPAAYLAAHWNQNPARPPLAGLILETPFTSLVELVHDYAPWFPAFLMKYRFLNREALMTYPGPILIFHGDHDEVIPFHHGEDLADALSSRGSVAFVQIPGGTHNTLFEYSEYQDSLKNWFLDSVQD